MHKNDQKPEKLNEEDLLPCGHRYEISFYFFEYSNCEILTNHKSRCLRSELRQTKKSIQDYCSRTNGGVFFDFIVGFGSTDQNLIKIIFPHKQ